MENIRSDGKNLALMKQYYNTSQLKKSLLKGQVPMRINEHISKAESKLSQYNKVKADLCTFPRLQMTE
jgi:pimeloyl-CoA synthetase